MQTTEKAIIIGVNTTHNQTIDLQESLDELEFLAKTAGAKVIKRFTQNLSAKNARSFIGSGKLAEVKTYMENEPVDLVIFDDELTPTQLKNIENTLKRKVIDRTNLILDIFALRAKTAQAKTQVELAQYQYLLPRLTRMWTHLERQRGGIGLRGPGETEIETDRRIIRDKIALLKKKLDKIDKQNIVQRKNRQQKIRVALVGYTNSGKSTLMNLLSKSNVFSENKLFATLDTTVKKVVINQVEFLLSDTVGFIRKLPHRLVESFKSTLDEAREADVLLHIVDLSHVGFENHINTVQYTLSELDAQNKAVITVFNKIDLLNGQLIQTDDFQSLGVEQKTHLLNQSYLAKEHQPYIFISAKQKWNIEPLKQLLYSTVVDAYKQVYPHIPLRIDGHSALLT